MNRNNKLADIVAKEGYFWGSDVADSYHGAAARDMDKQWSSLIHPVLSRYDINYEKTVDFAGGFGRNTWKLLGMGAKFVTLVDVNPECIRTASEAFIGMPVKAVQTDGTNLEFIENDSHTFIYTFDAMVHFDPIIISAYLSEFFRVLEKGCFSFIHHSNYSSGPGEDFRKNPHWRNYMTMDLFKHFSIHEGFEVVDQIPIAWGLENLDCFTILRKA
jgi:ubiquinone/menaquinone biosynthesis C-methylase UbiE